MILKGLYHRLLSAEYLSRRLIFFVDLLLSLVSTLVAVELISFLRGYDPSWRMWLILVVLSLFCSALSFFFFHTYRGIIRHYSYTETGRFASTAVVKDALFIALFLLFFHQLKFGYVLVAAVADALFTFAFLVVERTIMIGVYNYLLGTLIPVDGFLLIYGNSKVSMSPVRQAFRNRSANYRILGYLNADIDRAYRIGGFPVFPFHNAADFHKLVVDRKIVAVLFTDRGALVHERDRLVHYCTTEKVKLFFMPDALSEVKKGINLPLTQVSVEDLLERPEIKINLTEISTSLKNKVVMVTGAAGSIGSELCRQLCSFGIDKMVLFDYAETPLHNIRLELEETFPDIEKYPVLGDVRNPLTVDYVIKKYRPQYIFHAAAYKHVPLMEENPCEAVRTNVYGTHIVADTAVKYGVDKFVMISTDKAVNPTNVMGASKRLAEMYIQSFSLALTNGLRQGSTHFITTRFGNVLGSNGSVIPRFRQQLAAGGPLTVTHPDIIRYFMTIPEACRLVLEAAFMGKGGEIFVFDMGEPVKIADLAKRMIELAGMRVGRDIEIQYTGLRPGEKLYEELLADKESTIPTANPKIFCARVREFDYNDVTTIINNLIHTAIDSNDNMEIVRLMKLIIPEFKSSNSKYCSLDDEIEKDYH